MKQLLIICPYPQNKAPSQRLKYEQYFPYFSNNGFEIKVKPFMSEAFWKIAYKPGNIIRKIFFSCLGYLRRVALLFTIRRYDIVYVHLWVTPFGPPVFEWLVRLLAKKIVFDIDDLVYLKNEKAGKWYIGLFKGRQKPIYLIKKADHVITCTPYLDNFVRKYNPRTTDISSTINTDTYIPVNTYTNNHQLNLGWSGSHSTIRYLELLKPVLQKLRKEKEFRLLVMGEAAFTIEGIEVEACAWTEEKEIPVLQKIDIGLYPLALDEEWVYGKSGLKALQYMALGIPTVATAIGANFRVMENGVSGFLVLSEEEWLDKLSALISDAGLRKDMGEKARTRVENFYSVKANAPVYLGILDKLANPNNHIS
jgi:glycosyltransferase involved in cell wall biosynthesis